MKCAPSLVESFAVLLYRVEKSSNHGNEKCTISRRRFNCIQSGQIFRGAVSSKVKNEVYDPAFCVHNPLRFADNYEARRIKPHFTGMSSASDVESEVKLCLPHSHRAPHSVQHRKPSPVD